MIANDKVLNLGAVAILAGLSGEEHRKDTLSQAGQLSAGTWMGMSKEDRAEVCGVARDTLARLTQLVDLVEAGEKI